MRIDIMNVKIVKLISGEDLISELVESDDIIVKNPVVMIPVNKEQIAFQPWLPYAEDKEYLLKETQVVLIATPSETIRKEYERMFGSGIVTPAQNSIIM